MLATYHIVMATIKALNSSGGLARHIFMTSIYIIDKNEAQFFLFGSKLQHICGFIFYLEWKEHKKWL